MFKVSSKATPCPICDRTDDGCKRGDGQEPSVLCRIGSKSSPYRNHPNLKIGDTVAGSDGMTYACTKIDDTADCPYVFFVEHKEQEPPRVVNTQKWSYKYGDGRTATRTRDDLSDGGKKCRWTAGTKPDQLLPLYYDELPESDESVFLVEGEKCADAFRALGLHGTSVPNGSGSWKAGVPDLAKFKNNTLVLCPDRDRVGVGLMLRVAETYPDAQWLLAEPLNRVGWEDPTDGYDVADWADDGATAEQVLSAVTETAPVLPTAPAGAPFRVLGWSADRTSIFVQVAATQQTTELPRGITKSLLLSLAPADFWAGSCIKETRSGPVTDWDAAVDLVMREADNADVYSPDSQRGTGIWMDEERVVWNRGDKLLIDGQLIPHLAAHSEYTYLRAGKIKLARPTSFDGPAILRTIRSLGWRKPADGLYLAGWCTLAPIAAALRVRPAMINTATTASGKTTVCQQVIVPLTGNLAWYNDGFTTEAGIRQHCISSSLPVVLDEAEEAPGKAARIREGLVSLTRSCYSGEGFTKGSQHGKAVHYTARLMVAFSAINFPLQNPADRNRYALIRREKLPLDDWKAAQQNLKLQVTPGAGAALVENVAANVPTILQNIEVFTDLLSGLIQRDDANRWGDTLGTLLAGAAWLDCQAPMDRQAALDWLDCSGWLFDQAETGSDVETEADQCLDFLLSYMIRWNNEAGQLSVGELLTSNGPEAKKHLGRLGLRKLDIGLFIANNCELTQRLFAETKWTKGGYTERLLELPGAERRADTFLLGKNRRGVVVPNQLLPQHEPLA